MTDGSKLRAIADYKGIQYVLGETGSVSCHGAGDVSDTYAAAVWAVDYLLYLATLKVSRVYFHQGTGFLYSSWMPIASETDGTPRFLHPQYYGNLLTAHALASTTQQVVMLASETSFTAYGIYTADESSAIQHRTAHPPPTRRHRQSPRIQRHAGRRFETVRRLTGPGADAKGGASFAGLTVDSNGALAGCEIVERLGRGVKMFVGDMEAVPISIEE
ncbi:hypothetical protein ASPCAL01426 [Aspergillus calidoustus]|uniref:Beta-glucuronidase C-terminal domain-containing protein n=1 Tax=Aspergillus calidoustus TaxID=454130 RepID=A0A0U5C2U9_ASPCI|nr:hypothetical protein ASPCAL01426 [Aspergillus calidoustus]